MEADLDTGAKRVCPKGEVQDAPSQPTRAQRGRRSAKADLSHKSAGSRFGRAKRAREGAAQGCAASINLRHSDFQCCVCSLMYLYFYKLPGRPLPNLHNNTQQCRTQSRRIHARKQHGPITYSSYTLTMPSGEGRSRPIVDRSLLKATQCPRA